MRQAKSTSEAPKVRFSKTLSWLLRHGAVKEGIPIQANGFVAVSDILNHRNYSKYCTLDILKDIVATDEKQRYTLRENPVTGSYEIRANQGHSLDTVQADECLTKISNSTEIPLAVHGTYYKFWSQIKQKGLHHMSRNHVHFATTDKIENIHGKNISCFRNNCQILIYLNVQKAMEEGGLEFYRSDNNVVLCAGKDGYISKEYFSKVVDRKTGELLEY